MTFAGKVFWSQYTFDVGTQDYGSFASIEDALKTPFISTKTYGRNLFVQVDEKVAEGLGYQCPPYVYNASDSEEWQDLARKRSEFRPLEGAAEKLKRARKETK